MFNSIPSPLPGNLVSQAFEATQSSEFGQRIAFASGTGRAVGTVAVTMSSWGCESGSWTNDTCVTTPGSTFSEPLTLNIYNVGPSNTVGSLITTTTQTFAIPYRPSADDTNCTGSDLGKWFDGTTCFNGFATNVTFDLTAQNVTLPDSVIFGVAYNTSDYGSNPYGAQPCQTTSAGCGYDSLNVALSCTTTDTGNSCPQNDVTAGTVPDPTTAYLNSVTGGQYCDGGTAGTGSFRLDSPGSGCWSPYTPSIEFTPRAAATLYVGTCQAAGPYTFASIQSAVDAANSGDTISICPGTYAENVTVNKALTITGDTQANTIVEPAFSNPDCGGAGGSSLCSGGSNVFLVQSDNVTIENLTVNGNNPNLTSTVTTNGVQIDARNGIIGDFNTSPGVFNNMVVQNVTAENIYLRGIYASTGGTFDFNHDTVTNVESDPSSVAMFNFGGSGNMSYNTVSYAGDAISSNWSGGVTFEHNTVTQSGSGIHTDNSNGFGTNVADIIKYNTISSCTTDGYGVWDFVPYVAPVISNNTVTGCAVGLGSFGSANPVTTVFTHNIVDGTGATVSSGSSIGAYISTTEFGFGDSNVNATLTSNTITHFGEAADVEQTGSGPVPTVAFHFNRLTGNAGGMINNASTAVNASDNWWGCNAGPGNPGCDPVGGTGIVGQNPWLVLNLASAPSTTTSSAALTADLTHDNNGTDTSSSGFLPDGTVVGFSTNLGHLSASSASTVNGKAAVNLSPAGQFGTATATATLDNQSVSTSVALTRPSLSINSVSQVSGSSGTTPMTFTVSLSSASDTQITVHYATINWWATSSGTGFANPDFDAASGTLTFPPGTTTQPVTVTLHGYPANEANEPFKVGLSAPSTNATIANAVGIGSILNNNPLPIVTVSPPPSSVVAGSPAVFTINLSAASDQTVTVNYNTSDVSARQPVDYKATIGTATFPHGTTHVTVSVPTVHDASPDGTETFKLLLTSPKHATGHWPNWATATIAAH